MCIDGGDTAKHPHRTEYAQAYDAGCFGHGMFGLGTYTLFLRVGFRHSNLLVNRDCIWILLKSDTRNLLLF